MASSLRPFLASHVIIVSHDVKLQILLPAKIERHHTPTLTANIKVSLKISPLVLDYLIIENPLSYSEKYSSLVYIVQHVGSADTIQSFDYAETFQHCPSYDHLGLTEFAHSFAYSSHLGFPEIVKGLGNQTHTGSASLH
nr:hypothetical protein CFP56_69816 [Quercus suber]